MKQIITTLLVSIILLYTGESKPKPAHYNNWIFGDNAGITFTTPDGNPKALELIESYRFLEGTSSISDDKGDLLYYLFLASNNGVNGIREIKSSQGTISNGDGILSGDSPSNSGLFIQDFTNTDLYYYISVADATTGNAGMSYNIIDKTKNGGKGEVILKNKNLYKNSTEKMTAVMNEVDNICWVITHEWDNDAFKIIRIDESGLDENIITQKIGLVHNSSGPDRVSGVGRASMSPDGTKLAITVSSDTYGKVQLFDFDPKVGKLSNPRTLSFDSFTYSICFSPNGKVLYVKGIDKIFQYDLSISDIDEMAEKSFTIETKKSSFYETIERGPNGIIYSGRKENTYLDAILNPDIIGLGCNYTEDVVDIGGSFLWALPTVINSYFDEEEKEREYEVDFPEYACFGDEFEIKIKSDYEGSYEARIERTYPNPIVIGTFGSIDSVVSTKILEDYRRTGWSTSYKAYITTENGKFDTLSFSVNGWLCCENSVRNGHFGAIAANGYCAPIKYDTDLDFRNSTTNRCPTEFTSTGQIASSSRAEWHNDSFFRQSKVASFFLIGDPTPNLPQRAWYQSNPTIVGKKYKFTAYVSNVERITRNGNDDGKELIMWLGIKSRNSETKLRQINNLKYEDGWVELSDEFTADYNTTELSIWVYGVCHFKSVFCVSYGFGIDEISLVPIDDSNFDIQNDTTICINDSFQTNNVFTGEIKSVSWTPTTGLSNPNILDPILSPDVNTVYTLTVEDKYGCEFVDSVAIDVDDCLDKCVPCVTYSFEDMEVDLGNGFCINASFFPSCADSTVLRGVSLYFEYDPYLMNFVTASTNSQIISNGEKNILRLYYDASNIKLNEFNNINICFTALLGNNDIAKLTQYEDENTKKELCVIGADSATITYLACSFPIRRVKFTTLTQFDAVYDDNKVKVSISTEETGLFKFVLLDPAGRIIKQDSFSTTKDKYENEEVVYFDANDLSTGVYFVRMQTPVGKIETQKLLIVK